MHPRNTPRAERLWLSWTKRAVIPAASNAFWFQLSMKKPRSSPNTFGSISVTSGMAVAVTITYARPAASCAVKYAP